MPASRAPSPTCGPACALALVLAAGCGAAQGSAATVGQELEGERVVRVPIGACEETPEGDGKRVSATEAGWAYVTLPEAEVRCDAENAWLTLGGGSYGLWLMSYVPVTAPTQPESMVEVLTRTSIARSRDQFPGAEVEPPTAVRHGAAERQGYCAASSFTNAGHDIRLISCMFHATTPDGVVHLLRVEVSDTPEVWAEPGLADEVLDAAVDAWFPGG